MFKIWRWTFARLYLRSERKWGEADTPAWTAACAVSVVIAFNLLAVLAVVTSVLGNTSELGQCKLHLLGAAAVILYTVHRRYVVKGGADKLIEKLRRESDAQTRREEKKLWGYTVGSLALPFAIALIAHSLGSC